MLLVLSQVLVLCSCASAVSNAETTTRFEPATPTPEQISGKTEYYYYDKSVHKMVLTKDFSLFEKMFESEPNERVTVLIFSYDEIFSKPDDEKAFWQDYSLEVFLDGCDDGIVERSAANLTSIFFRNYTTFLNYYDRLLTMTADQRIKKLVFEVDIYSPKYNTDDDTID